MQKVSAEWGWLARISAWTDSTKRHGWLPQDLNHGRLDLFFLFLAGAPPPPPALFACLGMQLVVRAWLLFKSQQ